MKTMTLATVCKKLNKKINGCITPVLLNVLCQQAKVPVGGQHHNGYSEVWIGRCRVDVERFDDLVAEIQSRKGIVAGEPVTQDAMTRFDKRIARRSAQIRAKNMASMMETPTR